jgi:sulfatase maturation enzyme AslB (radical SAM superfamily)
LTLHPNACSLLWKHVALGTHPHGPIVTPCCRFFLGEIERIKYNILQPAHTAIKDENYIKLLQQKMQNGEKLPECIKCWTEEAAGKESMRQHFNNQFANTVNVEKFELEYLEIVFSNLCNLACRMCTISDSSSWANLYNKTFYVDKIRDEHVVPIESIDANGKAKTKVISMNQYDFTEIDLSKLTLIKILGGEPMMSVEHVGFLKELEKVHPNLESLEIVYHTNVTKRPPLEVIEIWKKIGVINIIFSIDGYGEVNDYARTFSDWNTIEENVEWYYSLKLLYNINLQFGIHTVLNVLTAWHFDKLRNWITNDKNIDNFKEISIDFVRYPKYLNLAYMPADLKDLYIEKIKSINLSKKQKDRLINHMASEASDNEVWKEFLIKMKSLDKFTKKDLTKIIPLESY